MKDKDRFYIRARKVVGYCFMTIGRPYLRSPPGRYVPVNAMPHERSRPTSPNPLPRENPLYKTQVCPVVALTDPTTYSLREEFMNMNTNLRIDNHVTLNREDLQQMIQEAVEKA